MSEKETACGVHGQRPWWRDGHCICPELAAAEERGRRRGVEEAEAIEAHAKALADEADRRGTSIVIHRCPQGEWIIGFGENMQEVLAQEADFGNALFAATVMRALAPRDSGKEP